MTVARTEQEKNFISSLISGLANRPEPPTRNDVEVKARQLAAVFEFDGELNNIIEEVMIAIDTRMGAGVSLVDIEANHDEEWVYKREIAWTYSDAYEAFLKKERWHPGVVRSLSDVGTRILGHLQDPTSDGSWNRRGLVIGHVQSGKTANYIGVIGKAADAGYKFIVVSAGIHSNLRRQTQERIDEAFIGRSSDPEDRAVIGVGLNGGYPHPATLTNINDDFNKTTAAKSGWKINDFSKPIIIVIKKNVRTLQSLFKWLRELNARGDGRIGDVPMLFIDDEADNASINTNKPDIDPTKTNAMIRRILGLFTKSCYVGYTATPFANIFINPDAYDEDVREELFPRHFIYSLDPPNTYFGPHRVFLDETSSARILKPINDCEEYLPSNHKNGDLVHELPPSLYQALNDFIVARAIRNLRGQSGKHCSMLINVSRFVSTQRQVRDFISERQKKLQFAVKANYMKPVPATETDEHMRGLKESFEREFSDAGVSWPEVRKALFGVFDNLRIYVVNSKSDELLDYRKYEKDGVGLTAIAIGGLSLSRGLTIEGLTVSYMYRNTRMYDTLLQMGRWFGYRPNFEDLCRVHLSGDSINWYRHIAEATEELRGQITRMRRANLSPEQFGLYVQSHSDALLVTATNKMRAGQEVTVTQSYSGQLKESSKVPVSAEIAAENERLISDYWRNGFGGEKIIPTSKGWTVPDVDQDVIQDFMGLFRVHKDFALMKASIMAYLDKIRDNHPKVDVLLISGDKGGDDETSFTLGAQERDASPKRIKDGGWLLASYRVASRGDEKLGLTQTQIDRATAEALADESNESKDKAPSDIHFRAVRNKPLLMVHVLAPKNNPDLSGRIPAFGVSFPAGDYLTTVEIIANKVWIEHMYGSLDDDPDQEDDYDE